MRPITLTTSDASGGEKSTPVCPLDLYISPFNVTLQTIVTGAVTYTTEYTKDDVWATTFNPATAQWTAITGMTASAASAEETLISPVTALRMRQTAGAGSIVLRVLQAGIS